MTLTFSGRLSHTVRLPFAMLIPVLTPNVFLLSVWPLPISLATTLGISIDFSSSAYLDVSVRRVPFRKLWIHLRIHDSSSWGFPHSEIHGSMFISNSPWLIAGCRVLLRLLVPRHSPYALFRLNSLSCSILSNLQDRFLLELSQIIVWVVNSKDLSNLHCFFRRCVTTPCSKIVYPLFSGKTLIILNVFLNTTICFVSLFGFQ